MSADEKKIDRTYALVFMVFFLQKTTGLKMASDKL